VEEARKRKQPRKVELEEAELVITWRDGHVSRHQLEELRHNCPCATCRTGAQSGPAELSTGPAGELPMVSADALALSVRARSFDYVGRYGLRINWADGHSHGIYRLEQLRGV